MDESYQNKNIVFFTGAGMSAESGVPTYRWVCGLEPYREFESLPLRTLIEDKPCNSGVIYL